MPTKNRTVRASNKQKVKPSIELLFRRSVIISIAFTTLIAVLGLLGNFSSYHELASIRLTYIAMAPLTAICLLILSATSICYLQGVCTAARKALMFVLTTTVTIIGASEVLDYLLPVDIGSHHLINALTNLLGVGTTGQMSPLAGAAFIFAGMSALLLFVRTSTQQAQQRINGISATLGVLVQSIGLAVTITYLFGDPLLYGGEAIPMAATTALAFIFLGAALCAATGPTSFPARLAVVDSTTTSIIRSVAPMIGVMLIANNIFHFVIEDSTRHESLDSFFTVTSWLLLLFAVVAPVRKLSERFDKNKIQLEFAIAGGALGAWDWYPKTGRIDYGDIWMNILGYTPSEVIPHVDFFKGRIHPDDAPKVFALLNDHLSGKTRLYESEHRMYKKSGECIWVLDRGMVVERDEDGKPTRITGVFSDITKRIMIEQALKEEKTLTDAIIENMPIMVFLKDANDLRFTLLNQAGENLIGHKRDAVLGKSDYDFFPKEQAKFFIQKDREVLKSSGGFVDIPAEPILTAFNGERMIHTRKVRINGSDGTAKFLLGISEDVTDLLQIDKAKTEFVSLASHQLRSPTTAIKWYSEMLLDGDTGKLSKVQKKFVEVIHHGNQAMIELVDALLNVSRIDMGTFSIAPEPTDVRIVTDDVLKELKVQTNKKFLDVNRSFDENVPTILSDQRLIRIILQNLLSNATFYTPPEGSISIHISKEGDGVKMEVSDTGCGIPQAVQSKIYTKFYRADNARSIRPDGTGLGLYITKSVVAALGGTIHFTSKEGEGTTFVVTLPPKSENKAGSKKLE